MKNCLRLLAVLTVALSSPSAWPEDDTAPVVGLKGSKHDFGGQGWANGDSCIACHAQSRDEFPAEAPLWAPSYDFGKVFGDAVQDRGDNKSLPGPGTMICMRCHDGTLAEDMFGGLAAPAAANIRHPLLVTTGHGGTNHPVGIEYPKFDEDYRPMTAVVSEGKVALPGGRVECTSCHDPHNDDGNPFMLVKQNRRSTLCLTCHKK